MLPIFGVAVLATYWVAGVTKRWIEDLCIQLGARLIKNRSSHDKSTQD
ncbi:MAG: hypothetical protein Q7T00_10835 [Rugosibacter sp.]|jgi:hypothetical protein|nr:hypothetical protein [Rugosibacter sp.]